MSCKNLFPSISAGNCVRLLSITGLFFILAVATATEGYAQSRPVARLVTASGSSMPASSAHAGGGRIIPIAAVAPGSSPVAAVSLERRAFDLINAQRRANGQAPLIWDAALNRMARLHSENMGRLNYLAHEGPDGDMQSRARASNIQGWRSLGENIAYNQGFDDPAGFAVERWMRSEKHRANILRSQFTHSAIGVSRTADGRVYLTQVFITR
ncbi:MAG TPA: CAP domain-containing protein [Pyrinomonadaceae bacterium]|jgi:uncharacterized protein YkwD